MSPEIDGAIGPAKPLFSSAAKISQILKHPAKKNTDLRTTYNRIPGAHPMKLTKTKLNQIIKEELARVREGSSSGEVLRIRRGFGSLSETAGELFFALQDLNLVDEVGQEGSTGRLLWEAYESFYRSLNSINAVLLDIEDANP